MITEFIFYFVIGIVMYYCMKLSIRDFIKTIIIFLLSYLIILNINISPVIEDIILLELISFMFFYYKDVDMTEILFFASFLFLLKNMILILPIYEIIQTILYIIITLCILYIKYNYPIEEHNMYWGLLMAISLGTLIIYHILYNQLFDFLGINRNMIILFTLSITIMTSYFLFFKYTKLSYEQKLIEQAVDSFKNDKQQYSYIEKKNNELNQLRHDLKYDYLMMKQCINNNEFESMNQIIDKKLNYLNKEPNIIVSGNKIFDLFINSKLAQAKLKNIHTSSIISIQDISFISNTDLNIFVSQILDYAIELCTFNNKSLNIKIIQDECVLEMIVSIAECQKYDKSDVRIETIKVLLKKYDGHIHMFTENNIFYISILIPVI